MKKNEIEINLLCMAFFVGFAFCGNACVDQRYKFPFYVWDLICKMWNGLDVNKNVCI